MENTNWLKQQADKPLFPDALWSRPETKQARGKLLIIGGNKFSFAAPASAYAAAMKAGAGSVRVILPDSLRKVVGKMFPEAEFAPSTPSGSFARQALSEMLESAEQSDGLLLAGDFGRNSETAILLDSLAGKYGGRLACAQDSVDYFLAKDSLILQRVDSLLVINLGKLQKLAKNNRPSTLVLHNMTLMEVITTLADWSNSSPTAIVTKHADNLIAALGGKVSTTPQPSESNWQVELAAYASVWWLQQPDKPLESLTSSIYEYLKN